MKRSLDAGDEEERFLADNVGNEKCWRKVSSFYNVLIWNESIAIVFLFACARLNKSLCGSVCWSVRWSVHWSVRWSVRGSVRWSIADYGDWPWCLFLAEEKKTFYHECSQVLLHKLLRIRIGLKYKEYKVWYNSECLKILFLFLLRWRREFFLMNPFRLARQREHSQYVGVEEEQIGLKRKRCKTVISHE